MVNKNLVFLVLLAASSAASIGCQKRSYNKAPADAVNPTADEPDSQSKGEAGNPNAPSATETFKDVKVLYRAYDVSNPAYHYYFSTTTLSAALRDMIDPTTEQLLGSNIGDNTTACEDKNSLKLNEISAHFLYTKTACKNPDSPTSDKVFYKVKTVGVEVKAGASISRIFSVIANKPSTNAAQDLITLRQCTPKDSIDRYYLSTRDCTDSKDQYLIIKPEAKNKYSGLVGIESCTVHNKQVVATSGYCDYLKGETGKNDSPHKRLKKDDIIGPKIIGYGIRAE